VPRVRDNAVVTNNDFVSFAEDNLLSINASKTKVMQIHTHQTRNVVLPDLTINGTNVEAVHDYKFVTMGNLGVEMGGKTETKYWRPSRGINNEHKQLHIKC
jgi:hypothetical protein